MEVEKMKSKRHQDALIELLKKPDEATAYLNAAIREKDIQVFLLALRNVAEAFGGIGEIAKKTHLNRENLYDMLSDRGNPKIANLEAVLESMGFYLAVVRNTDKRKLSKVAA